MVVAEIQKKDSGTIAEIKIKRVPTGVSLSLKSKMFADLVKGLAAGSEPSRSSSEGWAELKFYNLRNTNIFRKEGYFGPNVGGKGFYDASNNAFDVTIFSAMNLEEGVTIVYPTPLSSEKIKEGVHAIQKFGQWLYENFIKPVDIELILTVPVREEKKK